jgi:hypothetical protein
MSSGVSVPINVPSTNLNKQRGMQLFAPEKVGELSTPVPKADGTLSMGMSWTDASMQFTFAKICPQDYGTDDSIARYTGSQKPTFSFNMMLVSLTPDTDIITPIKILLKGCYPRTATMGTMEAPYGYETGITGGLQDNDSASGLSSITAPQVWAVRAGRWFNCPMLVLDSCNVNFSQQCTPQGKPLFAEVQLVFETWRLITADEVEAFFTL